MPLKFVTVNDNVFPPRPLPGLRPWTPLGDFRPPDHLPCAILKFPLKIPWFVSTISCICVDGFCTEHKFVEF